MMTMTSRVQVLLALAVIVLLGLAWQTFRAPSVGSTAITEAPPSVSRAALGTAGRIRCLSG